MLCATSQRCSSDEGKVVKIADRHGETTRWKPYAGRGFLALEDGTKRTPAWILRDTGGSHTLVREGALPDGVGKYVQEFLIVKGMGGTTVAPIIKVMLTMEGIDKVVHVGVTKDMPLEDFDVILGNDLGGGVMGTLWDGENYKGDKGGTSESACEGWSEELGGGQ